MQVERSVTGNNVCTHVNSKRNRNGSEMVNAYGRKFFESPVMKVIRVSSLNDGASQVQGKRHSRRRDDVVASHGITEPLDKIGSAFEISMGLT